MTPVSEQRRHENSRQGGHCSQIKRGVSQRFDTSGKGTHASKAAALSLRTLQRGNAFRDALRHPLHANAEHWRESQSVR
ncbi:DUF1534 domain-containing protein [Pseudomonas syringae]|nr:DUF1534 domain-containing protein [Pseudomonas syringae]MCF5204023.1 DUF1534 domain-containing protein [Pseudomonas syringae]MCF5272413.1 DUF1534 domain-containing protein [Pseudomonas syringae]MCF5277997.1 DUF1534 domain-containing protein [Pseudomonas syringae]MCF5279447.1 DUF1534 domain-containing protein [Pseudomonas syringae]